MAFHKPPLQRTHRSRGAFTLVELLVVVAMLIILVSVLTAAMQPVLAGKEIREAARALNAFVAGSVARAAETGRPAGIWIQRQPAPNTNAAFDIFFAEVPPLYAGDTTSAAASFTSATSVDLSNSGQATVAGFITPGDQIRFVYAGPWYDITNVNITTPSITFAIGTKPPPPYAIGTNVPYQIQRGPRPSAVQPMQMPANTVIDLSQSGWGNNTEFASTSPREVIILFSPDGSVSRVYHYEDASSQFHSEVVLSTIHLLIGRPDQLGIGNLGTAPNENRWISIGSQTGRVITTENMGVDISTARQFANKGESMGGG